MAYQDVMQTAHTAYMSGRTKRIEFRREQLEALLRCYEENRDAMVDALAADLRRPKQEAIILEIEFIINDLKNTLFNLEEWAKPDKVKKNYSNSIP